MYDNIFMCLFYLLFISRAGEALDTLLLAGIAR